MKNKIAVMVITFLIMIALTPFIFGKLMNAKFDTMILKLQQQKGIEVKEIKDKSSYLSTDRIFEVTVPGTFLDQKEIKSIKLLTEVKFKNLPVTNVYFHNVLKNIILKSSEKIDLSKNKIVINVITPDFKKYVFVIEPGHYKNFDLKAIKGSVYVKGGKFDLNIDKILAENKKFRLEIDKFVSVSEKYKNFFKSENKCNIKVTFLNKEILIDNLDISNILKMDKKTSVGFKISFDNLKFSDVIKAEDFKAKLKFYDLNTTLFKKSVNSNDRNITLSLLANGAKIDLNSSLKDITLLKKDLGGFNLGIKSVIHKSNSLENFQMNPDKYVSIFIKADISEKLAFVLENYYPPLKNFLNTKPDKNGILHIKIDFDRGQIK